MAQAYTVRQANGPVVTGSIGILGQVPAGFRWVVRDIVIHNGFGGISNVTLYLNTGSARAVLWAGDVTPGQVSHLELRQVAYQGDALEGIASGGGISVLITGYEFAES